MVIVWWVVVAAVNDDDDEWDDHSQLQIATSQLMSRQVKPGPSGSANFS